MADPQTTQSCYTKAVSANGPTTAVEFSCAVRHQGGTLATLIDTGGFPWFSSTLGKTARSGMQLRKMKTPLRGDGLLA